MFSANALTPRSAGLTLEVIPRSSLLSSCADRRDGPDGRLYVTPSGAAYPSVTTVLGDKPKPELDAWREAVGEAEAAAVSSRATAFGTRVHGLAEKYLLGSLTEDEVLPDVRTRDALVSMVTAMRGRISLVRDVEVMMYSDSLGVAGTCDASCVFDGVETVLDFKTSSRLKHRSEIDDYFLQTTAYSMMLEELTGVRFDNMVIVMMVADSATPLVFSERRSSATDEQLRRTCDEYHTKHNGGARDYRRRLDGRAG